MFRHAGNVLWKSNMCSRNRVGSSHSSWNSWLQGQHPVILLLLLLLLLLHNQQFPLSCDSHLAGRTSCGCELLLFICQTVSAWPWESLVLHCACCSASLASKLHAVDAQSRDFVTSHARSCGCGLHGPWKRNRGFMVVILAAVARGLCRREVCCVYIDLMSRLPQLLPGTRRLWLHGGMLCPCWMDLWWRKSWQNVLHRFAMTSATKGPHLSHLSWGCVIYPIRSMYAIYGNI